MKTMLIVASTLALGTPALAQTMNQPTPATPSAGATATPPTSNTTMPSEVDATPDAVTTPTAVAPAQPSDAKAIIATDFKSYDKDANGKLNMSEFAVWMDTLRSASGQKALTGAEKTKWTTGAFATADKNKNKTIELAEIQTYLTAGG